MARSAPDGHGAVVVTGAHRSGTTLVGDIVCRAAGTWTVWEPFNRHWGLRAVDIAYPWLGARDAAAPEVRALRSYLESGRAGWRVKADGRRPLEVGARSAVATARRFAEHARHRGETPVVKDPFVLLALGALQPRVTRRTAVVTIRHPCSWLLSLRRMSWPAGHELNALQRQEELWERHLRDLLPRRNWSRADDLEAAARAWACLYRMVAVQAREGADVLVLPMEAFSRRPVDVLRQLFDALALPAPHDLEAVAREYAGSSTVSPAPGTKHVLQRDSRALATAWRSALSAEEVRRVRDICEPVFLEHYEDWDAAEGDVRRWQRDRVG